MAFNENVKPVKSGLQACLMNKFAISSSTEMNTMPLAQVVVLFYLRISSLGDPKAAST